MSRSKTQFVLLGCVVALLVAVFAMREMPVGAQDQEPPEKMETPTPPLSLTAISTITPTRVVTGTLTVTPTHTLTPTWSPTPTRTSTGTLTPTATPTFTPTVSLPLPTASLPPPTAPPPPTVLPPPTAPPSPTAPPTSTPTVSQVIVTTLQDYWYLLALGIAALFVFIVLVFWVLLRGRGKKPPTVLARAFLVSSEPPNLTIPIATDSVTIGRAKGCDIQITEKMKLPGADTLSRWHARLEKRGERWVLIDGGKPNQPSTNGVFVGGVRTRENYLRDGIEIRLGQVAFTFYTQLPTANPAQGGMR